MTRPSRETLWSPPGVARDVRGALLVVLVFVGVAGCVLQDDAAPPEPSGSAPIPAPSAEPVRYGLPPNAPVTPLPTTLELSTQWAKPLDVVTAQATARASTYAWYVGLRDARTQVTYVDGVPFLTNADTSAGRIGGGPNVRAGAVAPRARVDTGLLRPGDPPLAVAFPIAARYVLVGRDHAGGSVNVTVAPGGPPEAFVTLRDEGARLGFDPDEVALAPGGSVSFLDESSGAAGAVLSRVLVPLEGTGATLRVSGVDEGAYDVVVVARDGAQGRGVASEPFLNDFERPTVHAVFPAYDGEFTCSNLPPCGGDAVMAVNATYPATLAVVNLTTSSLTPHQVAVSLEQDGHVLSTLLATGDAQLQARGVHEGTLLLRLAPTSGALVTYHATLELDYQLPPPPGLRSDP